MNVAYALKHKRAALSETLQQLERERIDILLCALDRVILSYEPDYQASALTGHEERHSSRKAKPSSSEVKAAMSGVYKRQAILEILRKAGVPISVTDCAGKFASKLGIPSESQRTFQTPHTACRLS